MADKTFIFTTGSLSQNNPSTDPVVLWRGCSSLFGLFTENGPFRIGNDSQTVSLDQNSWNALANVLYLESPFGVGYSYTTKNGSFKTNDDTTARMNYLAVEDFFANNSFYITGELWRRICANSGQRILRQ